MRARHIHVILALIVIKNRADECPPRVTAFAETADRAVQVRPLQKLIKVRNPNSPAFMAPVEVPEIASS